MRASVSCIATIALAKPGDGFEPLARSEPSPSDAGRRARPRTCAARAAALSAATSAMTTPVAGLTIFMLAPAKARSRGKASCERSARSCTRRPCAARRRRGIRRGSACRRRRRDRPARGIPGATGPRTRTPDRYSGSPRRCDPAPTTLRRRGRGPASFTAWWWIELVLTSVRPGVEAGRARSRARTTSRGSSLRRSPSCDG